MFLIKGIIAKTFKIDYPHNAFIIYLFTYFTFMSNSTIISIARHFKTYAFVLFFTVYVPTLVSVVTRSEGTKLLSRAKIIYSYYHYLILKSRYLILYHPHLYELHTYISSHTLWRRYSILFYLLHTSLFTDNWG